MAQYVTKGKSAVGMSGLGGSITQWLVGGINVFFQKQLLLVGDSLKDRGGDPTMHMNFGSVPEDVVFLQLLKLPKHGPLRNTVMEVGIMDGSILNAYYSHYKDDLDGVFPYSHSVNIQASLPSLSSLLHRVEIKNTSAEPMPVGTGTHEYLRLPNGRCEISIRDESIEIDGPYDARIISGRPPKDIYVDIHGLGIVQMELSGAYRNEPAVIVVWTDGGRDEFGNSYICVEPVVANPRVFGTQEGLYVDPGKTLVMECLQLHALLDKYLDTV